MDREESFRLTLHSMNAQASLDFLTACDGVLYNCKWHMRGPFQDKNTQLVECNIVNADINHVRQKLGEIADGLGLTSTSWGLLPARL